MQILALLSASSVHAEGIYLAAPNRIDVAYDDNRGVLYVSNGGELLRYQVSSRTFLAPIILGGSLAGMDISPDGESLVVADESFAGGECWIYIISLATRAYQKISFPQELNYAEGGTFTAAYGSDGSILISSQYQGSGNVPLRRYVPSTASVTRIAMIGQDTMLRPNADHSVIAIAESSSSDGPFDRYRVSDGNLLRKSGYTDGTSWFNYEIAVSADATQYAIPTGGGTFITDSELIKQPAVVGVYGGGQPIGVAYNPIHPIVYFPWAQSSSVYIFDSRSLTELGTYDFESQFGLNGSRAFVNGRIKTSNDGALLFATVDGGVRFVTVDAIAPSALSATAGNVSVTLKWTASANASSYVIYQGVSSGGELAVPVRTGITGTSTTIDGLMNGTTYYFTVASMSPAGLSTPTTEASATPIGPPSKVTGLAAAQVGQAVRLSWTLTPGATSYTLYECTSDGRDFATVGILSPTYTTAPLREHRRYFFEVAAVNLSGYGPKSAPTSFELAHESDDPVDVVAHRDNEHDASLGAAHRCRRD
jgi:hypothetical protein